ncbi:hypothetical protein N431DRAFT_337511 [Stipitochalara longipes BDJ]|nr:hypothetical protein N431DRAFT_337511 [Stipitochalara longipes BDJ]
MRNRSLEEFVTLEVGEGDEQVKISVHQNILCAASPFFEAACKPEWMKSEGRVIKLPEDDPEAIRGFVYWAYYDEISIAKELPVSQRSDNMENAMQTVFGLLAKLYLLGEKYQIPRLKNDAIDATMLYNPNSWLPIATVLHIYENTLPESPFRKLMLDIVLYDYEADQIEECAEMMCRDFLVDLAISLSKKDSIFDEYGRAEKMPTPEFCKRYHTHANSAEYCRKKKTATFFTPGDI